MIMLNLQRLKLNGGDAAPPATAAVTLDFDARSRARLRVRLDDGREAGLFVDRGAVLRDGDLLHSEDGVVVRVRAAPEPVSAVYCDDPLLLSRLCYHLGNRHVALEIGAGRVAYRADHVLDQMVSGLGPVPVSEQAPFDPEAGAYDHGHAH